MKNLKEKYFLLVFLFFYLFSNAQEIKLEEILNIDGYPHTPKINEYDATLILKNKIYKCISFYYWPKLKFEILFNKEGFSERIYRYDLETNEFRDSTRYEYIDDKISKAFFYPSKKDSIFTIWKYTYNQYGHLTSIISIKGRKKNDHQELKYKNGKITKQKYVKNSKTWVNYAFDRDELGRVIKRTDLDVIQQKGWGVFTDTYYYRENTRVIDKFTADYPSPDSKGMGEFKYEYNSDGKIIKKLAKSTLDNYVVLNEFTYNNNGRLVSNKGYFYNALIPELKTKDEKKDWSDDYTYTYTEEGLVTGHFRQYNGKNPFSDYRAIYFKKGEKEVIPKSYLTNGLNPSSNESLILRLDGKNSTKESEAIYNVGEVVLSQWSDNLWYIAKIVSKNNESYAIKYMDGYSGNNKASRLKPFSEMKVGSTVYAKWKKGNTYYKATILSIKEKMITVKYTSDNSIEELNFEFIRLK